MHPKSHAATIELNDTCSFADAIIAANSDAAVGGCLAGDGADTISLSGDITLDAALPHITSEISIEGEDFTISGNNRFRIFANNGGTLTLDNLVMTKGFADWGGAIVNVNGGTLIIYNSTIAHSHASEGGAIGNDGKITVSYSELSNNTAEVGGAIHSIGGTLRITGSTFDNNTSDDPVSPWSAGGAIYQNGATVQISDSRFNNNEAVGGTASGGAIHGTEGSVAVSNSAFSSNEAGDNGGAVYQRDGAFVVEGSSFDYNTVGWAGGAIDCSSCTLQAADSRVSYNFASHGGGGISASTGRETMTLENCIITHNSTGLRKAEDKYAINGGGVYAVADGTISNCYIAENRSDVGGGIFISRDVEVTTSVVAGNTATEEGGGIYINGYDVIITNVTIMNNSAVRGGGLYRKLGQSWL